MLPRLPGKRLLFRLNAAPVHANHANRASAFAVSRIIDPSRLADPQAFVNPDYFASDSTKPDYALAREFLREAGGEFDAPCRLVSQKWVMIWTRRQMFGLLHCEREH